MVTRPPAACAWAPRRAGMAWACGLLLLACEPLDDPTAAPSVARCARPCAAACPSACLPSGYCAAVSRTAGELGLSPIAQGRSWEVAAGGFPPGAQVAYALNLGFDLAERAGRTPYREQIGIWIGSEFAFQIAGTRSAFPIWSEYQSSASADAGGALGLVLQLGSCAGVDPSTCSIDPASTLSFTLVNPAPWLEAPPCG